MSALLSAVDANGESLFRLKQERYPDTDQRDSPAHLQEPSEPQEAVRACFSWINKAKQTE